MKGGLKREVLGSSCCDLAEFRWTEPGDPRRRSGLPQWAISLPAYKVFVYLCLQSKQVKKIKSNYFKGLFFFCPSPECQKHHTDAEIVTSSSTNVSQGVCLFLCVCFIVSMCLCSVSVLCVYWQAGRASLLLLLLSLHFTLQQLRVNPLPLAHYQRCSMNAASHQNAGVKPNHYSSMGVSADIVTHLFSVFITFPSERSRRHAGHILTPA